MPAEAADAASHALALFRRQRERGHEAWALRLLGDIAGHDAPADTGPAEAHYQASAALASTLGMLPLVARGDLGWGLLLQRTGQRHRALQVLGRACARFRELGMSSDLARRQAALDVLRR